MIAFPLLAMTFSVACASVSFWDAVRRPKPERIVWTIAFIVFAVAAGSEVMGSLSGWSPSLARVYYLAGAVLVVGLLGLGELYLLFGSRMPALTPGVTLLVITLAVTLVWGAPIDESRLESAGWSAIEKGPALIALAASINILGTLVLCGGALWSAWRLRSTPASIHRALGCALIALGAIVVALGGTLTRLGQREYLYLAMTVGTATIFAGILQTRRAPRQNDALQSSVQESAEIVGVEPRLTLLPPALVDAARSRRGADAISYIVDVLLPLDEGELEQRVREWGATVDLRPPLSRLQATRVWTLRCELPVQERTHFDQLPLHLQAQIAELYTEVWVESSLGSSDVQPA